MKRLYVLCAVALLLLGVTSSAGVIQIPSAEASGMSLVVASGSTPVESGGGGGADPDLPTAEANHTYSILLDDGASNVYWTGLSTEEKARYGSAGSERIYTTMAAWETARDGEPGSGDTEVLEVLGAWDNDDTTAVNISGWATGSHVEIIAYGDARTTGVWDDTCYRIVTAADTPMVVDDDATSEIEGIQLQMDVDSAYDETFKTETGAGSCELRSSILVMAGGLGTNNKLARVKASTTFINVIGYLTGGTADGFVVEAGTVVFYNVLSMGGFSDGFEDDGGTTTATNCVSVSNGDDIDAIDTVTYLATDGAETACTGCVDVTDWSTVFADSSYATSYDFQLHASDTDLTDSGTDLSGTFTEDITGTTRSGTWDIGPFSD